MAEWQWWEARQQTAIARHNLDVAARAADGLAFDLAGELFNKYAQWAGFGGGGWWPPPHATSSAR
jgi:hypothetical protein